MSKDVFICICFSYEPLLGDIQQAMPDGVVVFLLSALDDSGQTLAQTEP